MNGSFVDSLHGGNGILWGMFSYFEGFVCNFSFSFDTYGLRKKWLVLSAHVIGVQSKCSLIPSAGFVLKRAHWV